jgi:hypothetical protein
LRKQAILFYLGVVSYILAIVEHLFKLGMLSWLYSTVDKTTVFYALVILGTAFIVTYFIEPMLKRKRLEVALIRMRPAWAKGDYDYKANDYDVEWHLFVPPHYDKSVRPWADGPYCPKCKRELEEEKVGLFFRKMQWSCPMCNTTFPMPKGDVKKMVERNLAAYLRKKGEL